MNLTGSLAEKLLVTFCALSLTCAMAPAQSGDNSAPSNKKPAPQSHARTAGKSSQAASRRGKRSRRASWRRGQQKVDPQRAREIQQALIREHYLKGEPTGRWDDATQRAMQRYQSDNGWQIKTIPDSRALIKLGLGPNHDHLLNPESAMTTAPQPRTANSAPADSSHAPAPPQK